MLSLLIIIVTQIIVESLPISSSSHVRAVTLFLESYGVAVPSHTIIAFACDFLHLPTLIIFACFFYDQWLPLVTQLIDGSINQFIWETALASSITVLWYLFFNHVWDKQQFPTWCGLTVTTALLASTYFFKSEGGIAYSWKIAAILGCVQGLALLPGISRLAATVVVGCWLGLSAQTAFFASVAMQAPLILAAVVRSVFYLAKWHFIGQFLQPTTLLVMVIATLGGYCALWLTYAMAVHNLLWVLAPYTLLLTLFFL